MLERLYNLIIIILLFFTDISYGSPKFRSEIASKRSDNLTYQLTRNVLPQLYTLKISPEIDKKTFTGYVKILIYVTRPIDNITLHQKTLNITKEKIILTTMDGTIIHIKDAGVSGTNEQEFYTISLNYTLQVNTYNLLIPEFYGVLNDENKGFYYAQYIDKDKEVRKFATTHFEATSARYAFPCFDEPSFRAKFKIYITRSSNYHSISNTKLIKSKKLIIGDLYEDEFEITPSMPTYIVAFIVSEMKLSTEPNQTFYRIFARPDFVDLGYEKYAYELAKVVLPTFETYFKVNYTLNKMDQVGIPNRYFSPGAMENWGLVTYGESSLLLTPNTSAEDTRIIDTTITHEFTHQWFGNLVTIKWWRYLWLKEGFAAFFQNRMLDMIKPEWKMMEQFIVITKQNCLDNDSSNKTRDINQDVGTPTEISNIYDSISYGTAACVIHMLETIMTPEVFQNGITNYLQDRSFQSAIPNDLYRNFQKAVNNSEIKLPENLNISKIMTTWDSQKGYPLIYVERNYNISQEVVELTQSRYTDENNFQTTLKPWFIPINYATQSNPNFNDTQFNDWLLQSNAKITITNLNDTEWLILNKQQAYYYRVNYDEKNWKLITQALMKNYSEIHILNRAQLIDDSFQLAKTDRLNFEIFLKISTHLYDEDNFITHCAFLRAVDYAVIHIVPGTDVEETFKQHITRILKSAYERLGHDVTSKDTLIDGLHRSLVLKWMGRLNYPECRKKCRQMFNLWRYENVQLPVDLVKSILCNTIRNEKQSDWEYLFGIYQSTKNNDDFKKNVFEALRCTKDVSSLQRLLTFSSKRSVATNYDFSNVVNLLSNEGLVSLKVLMNYLGAHFDFLLTTYGDKYITSILTTIASKLTTKEQVEKFSQVLKKDKSVNRAHRLLLRQTRLRITANQKRILQISKYFYEVRSNGNLSLAIPNTFYFILYAFIISIPYLYNTVAEEYFSY